MDTKWKNNLLIVLIVALFTFGVSGLFTGLSFGGQYSTSNYFESESFEWELNQIIEYVTLFELNYASKEQLKKQITVSEEEIEEHRWRYGDLSEQIANIKGQYEEKIQGAQLNNDEAVMNVYIEERDRKIEDITNNFKSDDHVRAKVIKEKEQKIDQYFAQLEERRSEYGRYAAAIQYYFKDTTTNKVFTNVESPSPEGLKKTNDHVFFREYPSSKSGYLVARQSPIYNEENNYLVSSGEDAKTFEGQIAISKGDPQASFLLDNYYDYKERQTIFFVYLITTVIALIATVFLYKKIRLNEMIAIEKMKPIYRKIPIDLRLVLIVITAFISFILIVDSGHYYMYGNVFTIVRETISLLLITVPFVAVTLLQAALLKDYIRNWDELKEELEKSIASRSFRAVKTAFLNRSIGVQQLLILVVVSGLGAGFIVTLLEIGFIIFYLFYILLFGIPTLIFVVKRTGYLNLIITNASKIAEGNFEPDLPVKGKSALALHANHINQLKHGVKSSQKEQAKSERLKTELITNVSHDLRTPLTSIITYTELLKTPELQEDDRNSYIEIIDRKSQRLKVLIDDLFEASKMASGNMELSKEKVDLVQLLQQALAEHDETIKETSLIFRVTMPETPVFAHVDGQKLWRVFDNLIRNIINYSLENTRVYISLEAKANQVEITFKNITKYELGGNIDEMFERFKRGDTSRQTEGSGLGLAIAKSIVDLHDGSLDIEVDGDLFKATVILEVSR